MGIQTSTEDGCRKEKKKHTKKEHESYQTLQRTGGEKRNICQMNVGDEEGEGEEEEEQEGERKTDTGKVRARAKSTDTTRNSN